MPPTENKFGLTEINEILKLQQLFHNKYLTTDFLHELVTLYVKAIQLFNHEHFFMKNYFMEKMQFVISRPQTNKLLQQGGQAVESMRQTLRISERQFQQNQSKSEDRDFKIHHEKIIEKETHHHYHYQQNPKKDKQRNMKIDMKVKVMREVQDNMKELQRQVKEQDKKLQLKEEMVKDIQKKQEEKLNQRLQRRKKRQRKNSVEIKPNTIENQEQQPEPIIQKQELKEAQRQLTAAVMKFTIRMTEKANMEQKNQANVQGRIKNKKIQSIVEDDLLDEEHEEEQKGRPQGRTVGRIKTRRQDNDEADYW